jgi:hypothetical protein
MSPVEHKSCRDDFCRWIPGLVFVEIFVEMLIVLCSAASSVDAAAPAACWHAAATSAFFDVLRAKRMLTALTSTAMAAMTRAKALPTSSDFSGRIAA